MYHIILLLLYILAYHILKLTKNIQNLKFKPNFVSSIYYNRNKKLILVYCPLENTHVYNLIEN